LSGDEPSEGLLDREWVLPRAGGGRWVGATYRADDWHAAPTAAGREYLLAACRRLTGRELRVDVQRGGVRVSVPDKRPAAGWWPGQTGRQGVMGALGSKGVLWAPRLARCWVEHLQTGRPLPAETDVSRLFPG
jgi:glycine/D-amino acid oxidase-like deaminating enzyme